jgi:hypothetical protein
MLMRVVVALGAVLACAHAAPVLAKAPAPVAVIPLAPYAGGPQLTLTVRSHGHDAVMLFDTGGGITVVTPQFAQALGCKPWGQITGFRMRGDRTDTPRCDDAVLQVGGLRVTAPSAGVFDFAKVLPKDAPPLDGALAMDAFAGKTITLDPTRRRLFVESPASLKARLRGAIEVPVRFTRDAEGLALTAMVAVPTPQGRLWMELDSGSDGDVIVGRHAAAALGLDPGSAKAQPFTLTLAEGAKVHTTAIVRDLIMDGNIGAPVLKTWVITLDLAHQRLWLTPPA